MDSFINTCCDNIRELLDYHIYICRSNYELFIELIYILIYLICRLDILVKCISYDRSCIYDYRNTYGYS